MRAYVIMCAMYCFGLGLIIGSIIAAPKPETGWTTAAHVTRVIDGDTLEVEFRRKVRVRLLDCWAPERKTPEGPASTENLKRLIGDGDVTLFVPTKSENFTEIFTFGRVLGHVWSKADADRSVSELQVSQGFATKEKQ